MIGRLQGRKHADIRQCAVLASRGGGPQPFLSPRACLACTSFALLSISKGYARVF